MERIQSCVQCLRVLSVLPSFLPGEVEERRLLTCIFFLYLPAKAAIRQEDRGIVPLMWAVSV